MNELHLFLNFYWQGTQVQLGSLVGFIGLGNMGAYMATNLMNKVIPNSPIVSTVRLWIEFSFFCIFTGPQTDRLRCRTDSRVPDEATGGRNRPQSRRISREIWHHRFHGTQQSARGGCVRRGGWCFQVILIHSDM